MADRPNILLFTVDDMNGDTPGCTGGPAAVTPRLDRLACEGTLFRRAHVPIAVCQPSRSAIMTGRWPHRNGAEGFGPIRDDVPVLNDLLRGLGYRMGIFGKVEHLEPVARFGWETCVGHDALDAGRNPQRYRDAADRFFAAHSDEPWFLMANAHDPHRPFHGSDHETATFPDAVRQRIPAPSRVFEAGEWPTPGFLPDLPDVRLEVAEYLSSCRRSDDVLGAVLDALAAAGQAERTLVIFLSDNGMALPFAKANCYLHSTRTPLVLRWPGHVPAGVVEEQHFVSTLDLFPTICAAVGASPPGGLDGRPLQPLLSGEVEVGDARDHVVTVFHETAAGRRFEMRCVQNERHGYIWNAWADGGPIYQAENMTGRTWPAMVAAAVDDPVLKGRCDHYLRRTSEELYCFEDDPDALEDLRTDAAHAGVLGHLRNQLGTWMASVEDPLAAAHAAGVAASDRPSDLAGDG